MLHGVHRAGGSERFSAIALHKDIVHLPSQISHRETKGIEQQTREVFDKIDALLSEANTGIRGVLSVQVWLADMNDYAAFHTVWNEWVAGVMPPTRVCLEARLAEPYAKVEILVIAMRDRSRRSDQSNATDLEAQVPEHLI